MLKEKILQKLSSECILYDEAQVDNYVKKRYQLIIDNHIHNVFPIKAPGEKGGDPSKWFTKLTPKNRNHDGKIRAKSREELEDLIVAHYIKIDKQKKDTVRSILLKTIDADSKTGLRALQRFDKWLYPLSKININDLNENHLKIVLTDLKNSNITLKEFNQTIGILNRIADYCEFEHIEIMDIKRFIQLFRKNKLSGKHIFKDTHKQTKNLYFTKQEVVKIINHVIKNPSYKSLAVATLIVTGLRVGELLGLRLEDIFLDEGYLWIHQIEDTKTYEIVDYVKENHSREVYLSNEAKLIIKKALDFRNADTSDIPYLFLNKLSKDGKLHIGGIDNYMRDHIHSEILGLGKDREARSPHDCRRTYATLAYQSGTDVLILKNQLGHSNVTQTFEYIKDIVEAAERKDKIKDIGILDASCTQQKSPTTLNLQDFSVSQ